MPMKPGTVATPGGSLTEAIEHALQMEWLAVKGEPLPETGADDRLLLLAAIAQGLLDYLKENQQDFRILLLGCPAGSSAVLQLQAPVVTLTPSSGSAGSAVTVSGGFFGSGESVKVVWDEPPTTLLTATAVNPDGGFSGTGNVPADAAPGEHVVAARDDAGHVALDVFTVTG